MDGSCSEDVRGFHRLGRPLALGKGCWSTREVDSWFRVQRPDREVNRWIFLPLTAGGVKRAIVEAGWTQNAFSKMWVSSCVGGILWATRYERTGGGQMDHHIVENTIGRTQKQLQNDAVTDKAQSFKQGSVRYWRARCSRKTNVRSGMEISVRSYARTFLQGKCVSMVHRLNRYFYNRK